jgi:uncharacterized membrane protein (Fun14 family)
MSEAVILPVVYQLGIGGIGGFFVGYAVKKIIRIAIIIGVFAFSLIYLAYTGVINVNFDEFMKLTGLADPVVGLLTPFLSALPFLGSFVVGLWFGFKKG